MLQRPDVFHVAVAGAGVSDQRLSSALLAAGRPHEVLLLPGAGHEALTIGQIGEQVLWHQVRFLQRHLGAAPAGA